MRQALHIFKKDVRHLWYQIVLVLAVIASLGWNEIRGLTQPVSSAWPEVLVVVTAAFMIAMLVHDEAIPGDRQYWITRPYAWKSLLGAKLLFIVTFVNLPIALAHLAIIIAGRFPLAHTLPGLLWSQVLLSICIGLPIAALAAVTARIPTFLFAVLFLFGAQFTANLIMQRSTLHWLEGVEWVRSALLAIGLTAIAAVVFYAQYRRRATWFSRAFALGGSMLIGAAYLSMPWPLAFAVQQRLSSRPAPGAALEFARGTSAYDRRLTLRQEGVVEAHLPLSIRGVPDGVDLQANALALTIQSPDGRSWRSALRPLADLVQHANGQPAALNETFLIDRNFFNQVRNLPVTLHVSIYLTLFGDERVRTIPLQSEAVNVADGLQCRTFAANRGWDVFCNSLFRWPPDAVYAQIANIKTSVLSRFISYSPFPAGLSLSPVETRWGPVYPYGPTPDASDVTIIIKKPVAHFRRDFELHIARLVDLAIPWRYGPTPEF